MRIPLICILALAGVLPARPATAQVGQGASRAPVLLAIVDSLSDTSRPYRIARVGGESAREIVLLPPHASPVLLTEALQALRLVWVHDGQADAAGATAVFRRSPGTAEPRVPRVLPWAARVLGDLREAQPRHVPGVGYVKAVRIWLLPLPAQAVRRGP